MLTVLDECLWHQLPTTFDHVGTSDPRFFDRFWFAIYAQDGTAALQHALGVYNNMDVVDGGVVLVHQGQQHNARFSRSLRPDFVHACGPLKVDVIEALQRFRVMLDPGEHGIAVDLEWKAVSPPEEEKPHFQRRLGRVTQDYQRFNKIGLANGTITAAGKTIEVRDWWGCRDHSWGVRPGMGIPEPAIGAGGGDGGPLFFCFLFFSTDTLAGHVQLHESGGDRYVTILLRDRRTGEEYKTDEVRVAADFIPGTTVFSAVDLTIDYRGQPLTFSLTRLIDRKSVV